MRPLNKYSVSTRTQLNKFLSDLGKNNVHITDFIGDNPKRSLVRESLSHSSKYACEYCFASAERAGVHDIVQMNTLQKKYDLQTAGINSQIELLTSRPGTVASKEKDDQEINILLSVLKELGQSFKLSKKKVNKTNLVWPASTSNGTPRTTEDIIEICDLIDNSEGALPQSVLKGINGRSLLLDLPNFSFVDSIPAEYMHSVCLGVIKRMIELTLSLIHI